MFPPEVIERFWSKVEKTSDCWNWTAAKSEGYGHFSYMKKWYQAHRVAYLLMRGELPKGLVADHLCRNRSCVNPNHIEFVTIWVNTLRGDTITGREALATHCRYGHPYDAENTIVRKDGHRACRICNTPEGRRVRGAYNKILREQTQIRMS